MKKFLITTVSQRNGSNSKYASRIFREELERQGAFEVEEMDLSTKNIMDYQDTRDQATPNYPADDFEQCLEKVLEADVWIVFSPVHWCGYAKQVKTFIDRFSEAMRRQEFDFSRRMQGKEWGYVMVSGENASSYQEAFWHIHETICNYPFIGARAIRGPWFVANSAFELERTQSGEVAHQLADFVEQLTPRLFNGETLR